MNIVSRRLRESLKCLGVAIRQVEEALAELRANHDPLASHIFTSRRAYQCMNDTKSGKRRAVAARISYNQACELGFRGSLDEWDRLMGAAAKRSRTIHPQTHPNQ